MMTDDKRREHYETLGLKEGASMEEIKREYKKRALLCHPDKNQMNPDATQEFQQLSEAYQAICDDLNYCVGDDDDFEFDAEYGDYNVREFMKLYRLLRRSREQRAYRAAMQGFGGMHGRGWMQDRGGMQSRRGMQSMGCRYPFTFSCPSVDTSQTSRTAANGKSVNMKKLRRLRRRVAYANRDSNNNSKKVAPESELHWPTSGACGRGWPTPGACGRGWPMPGVCGHGWSAFRTSGQYGHPAPSHYNTGQPTYSQYPSQYEQTESDYDCYDDDELYCSVNDDENDNMYSDCLSVSDEAEETPAKHSSDSTRPETVESTATAAATGTGGSGDASGTGGGNGSVSGSSGAGSKDKGRKPKGGQPPVCQQTAAKKLTKKQLLAEQRRKDRECEEIRRELEEKKLVEQEKELEREKKRKAQREELNKPTPIVAPSKVSKKKKSNNKTSSVDKNKTKRNETLPERSDVKDSKDSSVDKTEKFEEAAIDDVKCATCVDDSVDESCSDRSSVVSSTTTSSLTTGRRTRIFYGSSARKNNSSRCKNNSSRCHSVEQVDTAISAGVGTTISAGVGTGAAVNPRLSTLRHSSVRGVSEPTCSRPAQTVSSCQSSQSGNVAAMMATSRQSTGGHYGSNTNWSADYWSTDKQRKAYKTDTFDWTADDDWTPKPITQPIKPSTVGLGNSDVELPSKRPSGFSQISQMLMTDHSKTETDLLTIGSDESRVNGSSESTVSHDVAAALMVNVSNIHRPTTNNERLAGNSFQKTSTRVYVSRRSFGGDSVYRDHCDGRRFSQADVINSYSFDDISGSTTNNTGAAGTVGARSAGADSRGSGMLWDVEDSWSAVPPLPLATDKQQEMSSSLASQLFVARGNQCSTDSAPVAGRQETVVVAAADSMINYMPSAVRDCGRSAGTWSADPTPAATNGQNVWMQRQAFYNSAVPRNTDEEERMLQAALELSRLEEETDMAVGLIQQSLSHLSVAEAHSPRSLTQSASTQLFVARNQLPAAAGTQLSTSSTRVTEPRVAAAGSESLTHGFAVALSTDCVVVNPPANLRFTRNLSGRDDTKTVLGMTGSSRCTTVDNQPMSVGNGSQHIVDTSVCSDTSSWAEMMDAQDAQNSQPVDAEKSPRPRDQTMTNELENKRLAADKDWEDELVYFTEQSPPAKTVSIVPSSEYMVPEPSMPRAPLYELPPMPTYEPIPPPLNLEVIISKPDREAETGPGSPGGMTPPVSCDHIPYYIPSPPSCTASDNVVELNFYRVPTPVSPSVVSDSILPASDEPTINILPVTTTTAAMSEFTGLVDGVEEKLPSTDEVPEVVEECVGERGVAEGGCGATESGPQLTQPTFIPATGQIHLPPGFPATVTSHPVLEYWPSVSMPMTASLPLSAAGLTAASQLEACHNSAPQYYPGFMPYMLPSPYSPCAPVRMIPPGFNMATTPAVCPAPTVMPQQFMSYPMYTPYGYQLVPIPWPPTPLPGQTPAMYTADLTQCRPENNVTTELL